MSELSESSSNTTIASMPPELRPGRARGTETTIADYVDASLPRGIDGRSLRAASVQYRRSLTVFAKRGPAVALRFSNFRLQRMAAVDRVSANFGSDDHWNHVFAPGDPARSPMTPNTRSCSSM